MHGQWSSVEVTGSVVNTMEHHTEAQCQKLYTGAADTRDSFPHAPLRNWTATWPSMSRGKSCAAVLLSDEGAGIDNTEAVCSPRDCGCTSSKYNAASYEPDAWASVAAGE